MQKGLGSCQYYQSLISNIISFVIHSFSPTEKDYIHLWISRTFSQFTRMHHIRTNLFVEWFLYGPLFFFNNFRFVPLINPFIIPTLKIHYKTKIYKGNIVHLIRWIAFRLCANCDPCLLWLSSQRGSGRVSVKQTMKRDNEMVASEIHALILSLLIQTY